MPKVIYIAGAGRSGSTILDSILGQIPGFFSVGELHFIWKRGLVENRLCACGMRFAECPAWKEILEGIQPKPNIRTAKTVMKDLPRSRNMPFPLTTRSHQRFCRRYSVPVRHLGDVIESVADRCGGQVVVDSSKGAVHGILLSCIPNVDLRVVHLIRDPRAVAYSWMRKKPSPDRPDGYMTPHGPTMSSLWWNGRNLQAEQLRRLDRSRYLRVSYERFASYPRQVVEEVLSMASESGRQLPFVSVSTVDLQKTHSVSGNPSRFISGRVVVEPDSEWLTEMGNRDRAIVEALTWPLMPRYGYSLRQRWPRHRGKQRR
jgi:hypothetical protein